MTIETPTEVVRHTIGLDGLFVLRVRTEDVAIRGIEGPDVLIHARGGRPLGDLDVERGERSLEIRTGRGRGRDLEVSIPRTAHLVLEGANADIRAEGLAGDQRYRLVAGDLELRGVRGHVHAEAMSGDIDIVAEDPARFDVRTVSGDIEIRAGVIESLRAGTTSGDMRVAGRLQGDGPFGFETVSGDVVLAPAGDIRVEIRTITGDVRCDMPARLEDDDGRRSLVVGAGGPTVTFRSTSGDLRVVRAMARRSEVAVTPEGAAALATPVVPDAPTGPFAPRPALAAAGDARLGVLRALERGDIDVAEAGRRLETLDGGESTAWPAAPSEAIHGPQGRPGAPEEMDHA